MFENLFFMKHSCSVNRLGKTSSLTESKVARPSFFQYFIIYLHVHIAKNVHRSMQIVSRSVTVRSLTEFVK